MTWLLLVILGPPPPPPPPPPPTPPLPPPPPEMEEGEEEAGRTTVAGAEVVEAGAEVGLDLFPAPPPPPPPPPVMEVTEDGLRSFSAPEGAMPCSPVCVGGGGEGG